MTERDDFLRLLGDAWRSSVLSELTTAKAMAGPQVDLEELKQVAAQATQLCSDREFIRRAAAGDRSALDHLVERLAPSIQRRVRRRMRRLELLHASSALEKDLVQDCMVRLFAQQARLLRQWKPDRGASLDSWCGYVADSVVLAHSRSGRKSAWREITDEDDDEQPALPWTDEDLEAQTLDRAFLTDLMVRLRKVLTPAKLNLFWALYVEERDPEDIALELGKSRDAIYMAKARLVQQVQAEARRLAGDGKPK